MKSIFDYSDANNYLKDKWETVKGSNPHLSVRSFANFLELGSHGPLHQMLLGKRKISQSYIPKLVSYFEMNERESMYFDTLVKFSRCQTIAETNFYLDVLKDLRPKSVEAVEVLNSYEIQKNPLHFFIMELAELMKLPNDYNAVKAKLSVGYTSFEVKSAIQLLVESGLLAVDDRNILRKTHKHLYSTQDKKSMALVQYHQKLSALAHSAVESQDVLEREFNGTSFNINKEKLPAIKEELRAFLKTMIEKYESNPLEGDSTYQLNLQFFKVAEK